jgi:aspartate aminotransferase
MESRNGIVAATEVGERRETTDSRVSGLASGMRGSEILKISSEVRALQATGGSICNLTVGDFSPAEFRIPAVLENGIAHALSKGETNYPPSEGIDRLRRAIAGFYRASLSLDFPSESILVTSGTRPGIFATYNVLLDPGDVAVYPVPSWNNNHYCHLARAIGRPVVCGQKTAFLPTRTLLESALEGARLIALNSPLNPTGTAFTSDTLGPICDLVLEENDRRKHERKRPLFVLYDQVYWMLTFDGVTHVHPVGLRPEMAEYTIYVDGISKAFAATGVRVGWVAGPLDIIRRMASFIGHVGAWAPRAEQTATAHFLEMHDEVRSFIRSFTAGVNERLDQLHTGIVALGNAGFPVRAIPPMGAIYLSVQFQLSGKRTPSGELLATNEDIRQYLLQHAGMAVVPFQAFGTTDNTGWFRLSVGAVSVSEIKEMFDRLGTALAALQ